MGRSPYLQTWHKLPTLTASDFAPSALRQTLPLEPDSVPPRLPRNIPSESTPLKNPYLSRGRQIGGRKKTSSSPVSAAVADDKAMKVADLSSTEKESSEPSRLYLRRWYPS